MKEVPKYVLVDKAWGIVHVEKKPRSGGSATFTTPPPTPPTPPAPVQGLVPPQGGFLFDVGGNKIIPP